MNRIAMANALALAAALALSVLLAGAPERRARSHDERPEAESPRTLVDATGVAVEARAYARIASASSVVDRLLLELCAPTRVIAFTEASAQGPDAHRFEGRPTIASIDDVERVIALRPELVLVHNVADARRVERLREAGLAVFDLGPLRGRETLEDDIVAVATFCGAPERGARYARTFAQRLDRVAAGVPARGRRSAMYLAVYGDRYFGGTTGTSYHDVLEAAGLRDAAASRYEGWPQYTVEQILELDPDVVITRAGMRAAICEHPVLGRLAACAADVVEIDPNLLDAPGPGMLEAAEAIRDAL